MAFILGLAGHTAARSAIEEKRAEVPGGAGESAASLMQENLTLTRLVQESQQATELLRESQEIALS